MASSRLQLGDDIIDKPLWVTLLLWSR